MESRRDSGAAALLVAATAHAAVALAATWVVHESGRQIVDTGRYLTYATAVRDGLLPYRDVDVEYPPVALAVFVAPSLVASERESYLWAFAFLMALAGATAVVLTGLTLRRLGRSRSVERRLLALLAVSPVLFGGVLLTRFDLVPAALVAGATLLAVTGRLRSSAAVLGLAAATKLYPLLLLPVLVTIAWRRRGSREAATVGVCAAGVVALAYLPFLVLAPGGVADSLWVQLSRPLQIESVGSGLLLLLDRAGLLVVGVESSHGSQNVTGAAAEALALSLTGLSAAVVLAVWVAFARGEPSSERTVRCSAAVLLAAVGLGKVLSPQFLVWLLFPLVLPAGRRGNVARGLFWVAAAATAVWFPFFYFDLPRERDPQVAALVVVRGLALVAALAVLVLPGRFAATATGRGWPRSRSRDPTPPRT